MSNLTIIAAMTDRGVIGWRGKMPWHIPEEMAHFRATTMGHPIVMGYKTARSVGALPGRTNILYVDGEGIPALPGFIPMSKGEILNKFGSFERVFIGGGAATYREFMPYANEMVLSVVNGTYVGDTSFPMYDDRQWEIVRSVAHDKFTVKHLARVAGRENKAG